MTAQECAALALQAEPQRKAFLEQTIQDLLAACRQSAAQGQFSIFFKIHREYLSEIATVFQSLGYDVATTGKDPAAADVGLSWASAVKAFVMEANESQR